MDDQLKLINLEALPEGLREHVKEDVKKYGESTVFWMLQTAPLKQMVIMESNQNDTIVWCQMAQHIVTQLASKDPIPPHYIVAREILTEALGGSFESQDQETANMLALEILRHCQILKERLFKNAPVLEDEESFILNKDLLDKDGNIIKVELPVENGMLWLDDLYLKYIATLGEAGKKEAEEVIPFCQQRCTESLQESPPNFARIWQVWVNKEQTFTPLYLTLLAKICWLDIVEPKWKKKNKLKTPAIPKGLWKEPIKELLVKNNQVIEKEQGVEFFSEDGRLLVRAEVATIDKNLLNLISGGFRDLSTLTGHKTYRWLIRTGFENVINGEEDARVIRTRGGYEGISHLIGCKSKDDPQKVKRILHALAYGNFETPNGRQGTLISIEIVDTHRNGSPTEIDIVLGTQLLPHYVFEFPKGEAQRLIPVPQLPPFAGDPSSYASQSMLQLYLMEEVSNQSREFAKNGYIHLSDQKWEELSRKAHLPISNYPKVRDRWLEADGMLERDGEYYTLNKRNYKREYEFLIDQGKGREKQSIRSIRGKERAKKLKKG